jgi:hypothetical protein
MPGIDESKAKVYVILGNLIIKFLLSIAAIVAFFIVLYKYMDTKNSFDAIKYGAIEVLLGGSVFLAFRHYFGEPHKG